MAGNATVTLYNGKELTTYELWLQRINTATSNEFMSQQVRDRMSWIPIRRAEMFMNFSIAWPLRSAQPSNPVKQKGFEKIDPADGFAKMNLFQDAIRAHQLALVNGSITTPMVLNYYNNSNVKNYNKLISEEPLNPITISGFIQTAEKMHVRFQNVFTTDYTMNMLTANVAKTPMTTPAPGSASTYAPSSYSLASYSPGYKATVADQNNYGVNWMSINNLTVATQQIQGLPGQ